MITLIAIAAATFAAFNILGLLLFKSGSLFGKPASSYSPRSRIVKHGHARRAVAPEHTISDIHHEIHSILKSDNLSSFLKSRNIRYSQYDEIEKLKDCISSIVENRYCFDNLYRKIADFLINWKNENPQK